MEQQKDGVPRCCVNCGWTWSVSELPAGIKRDDGDVGQGPNRGETGAGAKIDR